MHAKRDWLISLREQLKLTQRDVADKAEIPRSTYANIEVGRRNPTVDNARRIANVIGFDWTIFFANEGRNKRQNRIA
jgi:transcriptional regulator with XRE-family HTH domain